MSTFDGLVDEFPNIRIDYFRHHPDKSPPQACFLSHVHSDHLQGLESLKMPFVYCSATTKNILLRMEKYPHRINFAKGILEARKQTYKSLKLVLRALPVETPVELELGPKSRIRVTLFDANHCPGAVMFLIEGDDRAVLYTGDIRAESWWVNSIVRNPILLPYSCGARRLDCIYLDTTFASRENIYEAFPSKSEGIKELLTRVRKCPVDSIFYFRSWTLGYEDVWIALSNFLHASIHVDEYQFRLFRSLSDNTVTGCGAALAGFDYGNQRQPGCLTSDEAAPIHSCEPGTKCHDWIKKQKNVIWITPIISRLKDGTEIAELGAGGGGGDLYQTPQLELIDEAALHILEDLCAGDTKHKQAFEQLRQALSEARAKGFLNIDLDGLSLCQDEEVSIKEFLRLVAKRDEVTRQTTGLSGDRIIHFPYSRHSSFSELRHLLSCFRPRDIYPCTVDIDTWSEDVSVEALFGDLCHEQTFRYDRKMRAIIEKRRATRGKKRKRVDEQLDTQETASQISSNTEEIYRSAKTSMRKVDEDEKQDGARLEQHPSSKGLQNKTPTSIHNLQSAVSGRFRAGHRGKDIHNDAADTTAQTRDQNPSALTAPILNHDLTSLPLEQLPIQQYIDISSDSDSATGSSNDQKSITNSLSISNFVSLPDLPSSHLHPPQATISSHDPQGNTTTTTKSDITEKHRLRARKAAYHAAKTLLDDNDPSTWQNLRLRSLGWKGHTEKEVIL